MYINKSLYKVNDCNVYKIQNSKTNKNIYIINYGEIHGEDTKVNFKIFDKYNTMFYVEQPFRLFNKNFKYKYFKKINSKSTTKRRQKNGQFTYSPLGYDNMYYLNIYFSKWFKDNNYTFNDKNDKQIISKSKQYNTLWNYCPCEYRDNNEFFYDFTEPLYQLLQYYIFHIKYNNFNQNINNFLLENINNNINCLKLRIPPYNIFKQKIIDAINVNKYDTLPYNETVYKKIHNLLTKYYNKKEFIIFVENPTFNNLDLYFKKINLSLMTIDLFNIITFFYYENNLIKYKSITEFIKYYYDYLIYSVFPINLRPFIISPYDIILYINLNENITKYEYHIIYNGTFHRYIFQYYLSFMLNY